MKRASLPVARVRIASLCSASWEEMKGDDRIRTCDDCHLQVFNLSGMSQHEAEELIAKTEGRLCVRLYRRADGTVITADCPLGLGAFWRGVLQTIACGVGIIALGFATLAEAVTSVNDSGGSHPGPVTSFVNWVQNKLCPRPIMGAPAPPTPPTRTGMGLEAEEGSELQAK